MSHTTQDQENPGKALKQPQKSSADLPDWIIKPFEGMAPGRPASLKPYIPPRQGLLTFERLRLLAVSVLLGGMLLTFFLIASQPFNLLNPDPPGLNRDVVTAIPTRSALSLSETPTSHSVALLTNLSLDAGSLNQWTDQKWVMLSASSSFDLITSNSYVYSSLQALKPAGFASQEFIQDSSSCAPFCQVSWTGFAFDTMASALKAFELVDNENKSSMSGYSSLGFFNAGSAPAWSCISKLYPGDQNGWVTCLFVWGNLLTSTRVITQASADQNFTDPSMYLIDQINTAWRTRLAHP